MQNSGPTTGGGSLPTPPLQKFFVEETPIKQVAQFMCRWHYNNVMPRLNKVAFGAYADNSPFGEMVGGMSFGWGSRPRHTIQKLFPSLDTKDYFEIGKMALDDAMPKNSETRFLKISLALLKKKFPDLKLVYTWADGMWGKPGYVYQAANFLYGGFIWTDTYLTADGKRLHPLQLQSERRSRGLEITKRTERPSLELQQEMGWKHYFGKQFRYIYFLCSGEEKEQLLKSSTVEWSKRYPKHKDLEWKQQASNGRVACPQPQFTSAVQFNNR